VEITLRRLVQRDQRRAAKVEYEVEGFVDLLRRTLEVDRPGRLADPNAVAVVLALRQIDLVAESIACSGKLDAGIAARAQIQIDRVAGAPAHVERAEPAADRRHLAACTTRSAPAAEHRRLARVLQQHADIELVGKQLRGTRGTSAEPTISTRPSER